MLYISERDSEKPNQFKHVSRTRDWKLQSFIFLAPSGGKGN